MKRACALFAVITAAFLLVHSALGFQMAYSIAYGMISVMALMISFTFLWLWRRRETPLALGMAFSWAGAASVLGWWWLYDVLERPEIMRSNAILFGFLALYFTGAVLHFVVMQRSMGVPATRFAWPVLFAMCLATILTLRH
ncbi:MAG: hypothetical protein AAFQ39_09605 [Pseudomonadota bacterium]